eukprot:3001135-Rhodomonas_salina.1
MQFQQLEVGPEWPDIASGDLEEVFPTYGRAGRCAARSVVSLPSRSYRNGLGTETETVVPDASAS